jgi:RNA polymerase sigma factor (sigma-70 family)
MKITAITKYKHGELNAALTHLGWSIAELARRCKATHSNVCAVINLKLRPSPKLANKIQMALGEEGIFLDVLEQWPEAFKIRRRFVRIETMDIPMERLIGCREAIMVLAPDQNEEAEGLSVAMQEVLKTLTDKERLVIVERFYEKKDFQCVADKLGVTPVRIRQIEVRALRKLRHPERICDLEQIAEEHFFTIR